LKESIKGKVKTTNAVGEYPPMGHFPPMGLEKRKKPLSDGISSTRVPKTGEIREEKNLRRRRRPEKEGGGTSRKKHVGNTITGKISTQIKEGLTTLLRGQNITERSPLMENRNGIEACGGILTKKNALNIRGDYLEEEENCEGGYYKKDPRCASAKERRRSKEKKRLNSGENTQV